MKGGKEKINRLVQWIKRNRLVRWFKRRDVSIQYLILFIALIFFTVIWNVKNIYFDTFEIDENSARYLLSALLQSQAAIIAIVITMTLVAVQLTASAYSPRVIDIFKNDRVMWLLLVWYGLSIFFGVFVLETIGSEYSNLNPWGITVSLEFYVFLAYLMGIVAFAGLFWHVGNVINLLKPKNIIEKLSEDITRNLLKFIEQKKGRTEPAKDDPVQPIVDIIHGSVMKYDIATTGYGLESITEKAIKVVQDYEEEISRHFCNHLERIGKLAVSREDGESVIKVLENLEFFGESTAEKGLGYATSKAARYLGVVGIAAAKKGLEDAASKAAGSLRDVGIAAAEKELEDAASEAAGSLRDVGTAAAEKELEDAALEAARYLGVVGRASAEKRLGSAAFRAALFLRDVGTAAAKKELEFAAEEAAESLGVVGRASAKKRLGSAAWQAAWSLRDVGTAAAKKELEDAASEAARYLGDVGQAAVEKGLGTAAARAAGYLGDVGQAAVEKGLGNAAAQAAKSLAELTISSEEIVKTTIRELEERVKEQDRGVFDKFMNLCEQQLEELRTQKPDSDTTTKS